MKFRITTAAFLVGMGTAFLTGSMPLALLSLGVLAVVVWHDSRQAIRR